MVSWPKDKHRYRYRLADPPGFPDASSEREFGATARHTLGDGVGGCQGFDLDAAEGSTNSEHLLQPIEGFASRFAARPSRAGLKQKGRRVVVCCVKQSSKEEGGISIGVGGS
jgi:hypothetical protein